MRRIILLFTVMSVALVVSSGVGWAAIKFDTEGSEFIEDTKKADTLHHLVDAVIVGKFRY